MFNHRNLLCALITPLVICLLLTGCSNQEAEKILLFSSPSPFPVSTSQPTILHTLQPTIQSAMQQIIPSTPTLSILGSSFDNNLTLKAKPVYVPLSLQIPSLKIDAPMVGVGITSKKTMDAPTGPLGDPIWFTAFWYRGSGVPGDIGTATIAGHVNDLYGNPAIFYHIKKLKPGDLIVIHAIDTTKEIRFIVDQVVLYTIQESATPAILTKIYGIGPVTGTAPQPAPDGLSHLTLITCAGNFSDGHFDSHIVVYATRSN
jgi:hypothetical protein